MPISKLGFQVFWQQVPEISEIIGPLDGSTRIVCRPTSFPLYLILGSLKSVYSQNTNFFIQFSIIFINWNVKVFYYTWAQLGCVFLSKPCKGHVDEKKLQSLDRHGSLNKAAVKAHIIHHTWISICTFRTSNLWVKTIILSQQRTIFVIIGYPLCSEDIILFVHYEWAWMSISILFTEKYEIYYLIINMQT